MGSKAGRESSARARELGGELRRVREQAALSGSDLARILGWSTSKMSRMESGTRGTSEVDVAIYLASCGVGRAELERLVGLAGEDDDGYWLRPHGKHLPDELRSLVVQENLAGSISSFELARVPGLLQTEDYAREMLQVAIPGFPDGVETRVQARMARQGLLRRHRAPRFEFLIHEQALRLPAGGARIMHEQLLQLVFAGSLPQVGVRVVPCAAGAHAGLGGPFRVMRYAQHPPVVYVENETASLFLEGAADVHTYGDIFAKLSAIALDEGQSREWLAQLASEYDRAESTP